MSRARRVGLIAGRMAAAERLGASCRRRRHHRARRAAQPHHRRPYREHRQGAAPFQPMNVNFGLFPPMDFSPKRRTARNCAARKRRWRKNGPCPPAPATISSAGCSARAERRFFARLARRCRLHLGAQGVGKGLVGLTQNRILPSARRGCPGRRWASCRATGSKMGWSQSVLRSFRLRLALPHDAGPWTPKKTRHDRDKKSRTQNFDRPRQRRIAIQG